MKTNRVRPALLALLLASFGAAGCGGVDESNFSATPGQVPPDAPLTPAEYDAKYPVSNAGDRTGKPTRGRTVTNP
jgi:hypothetical protein